MAKNKETSVNRGNVGCKRKKEQTKQIKRLARGTSAFYIFFLLSIFTRTIIFDCRHRVYAYFKLKDSRLNVGLSWVDSNINHFFYRKSKRCQSAVKQKHCCYYLWFFPIGFRYLSSITFMHAFLFCLYDCEHEHINYIRSCICMSRGDWQRKTSFCTNSYSLYK